MLARVTFIAPCSLLPSGAQESFLWELTAAADADFDSYHQRPAATEARGRLLPCTDEAGAGAVHFLPRRMSRIREPTGAPRRRGRAETSVEGERRS